MKLDRCEIRNFRSIKEIDFNFENSFQCLVGLNEAGKSNILKALSLLEPSCLPDSLDIRVPELDEPPINESHVWFVFKFDKNEQNEILKGVLIQLDGIDQNQDLIRKGSKTLSLKAIAYDSKEGLYCIDVKESKKSFSYWAAYKNWELVGDWREIPPNWSQKATLKNPTARFVNVSKNAELQNDALLAPIDISKIKVLFGAEILKITERELPICVTWKYDKDYLLPGMISTANFIAKPASCAPLKNMFELSGYEDASEALTTATNNDPDNGMRNLLRRVSSNATKHLHNVWPEYNKLKLVLAENGQNIHAYIEDKHNTYSLDRRSDGFKRFMTFLLMISVKSKASSLSNALIIIDEPDIALHPSGSQYLRKELMEISKNNYVIIATHSIFMIDKERIDRNVIVKKEGECSKIESSYSASMLDEEVIFKALGYSLYDVLKEKNIVFEGWTDKATFKKWLKSTKLKKEYKPWKEIGLIHALGAKDVARIANDLENLDRKYMIVSDSDQPSIDAKKRYGGKGQWLTYKDLGFINEETIEDFIEKKYVMKCVRNTSLNEGLSEPNGLETAKCFNEMIKMCSHQFGINGDLLKSFTRKIKNMIFENLDAKNIFIEELISKIDLTKITK
jgi:AAA15 family ATPase/GTPase